MKKLSIISTIIALAVLSACSGGQVNYSISVRGAENGSVVNLIDMLSGDNLATAELADGKAEFTGKTDKNTLLAVQKEGDDWQQLLFADGQAVEVNLEDNSLSGSELNEKLTECDKYTSKIYEDALEAIAEFGELEEEEQEARREELQAKVDKVSECYKQVLEENKDNLVPVAFLPMISQVLSKEEFDEVLTENGALASHPYTLKFKKQMDEYYALMEQMEAGKNQLIGQKFIDLEEPDVNGKMHKLSEYVGKGKWVFVDFWASWCGPCRREMPNVVAAYKKYHDKGLEIVGLSFDNDKDAWVKAIKDLEMPWIHLSDLKGWQTVASDTYNVKSIPASILVDPEGIVVARDLRGDALGAKLAEIFGE